MNRLRLRRDLEGRHDSFAIRNADAIPRYWSVSKMRLAKVQVAKRRYFWQSGSKLIPTFCAHVVVIYGRMYLFATENKLGQMGQLQEVLSEARGPIRPQIVFPYRQSREAIPKSSSSSNLKPLKQARNIFIPSLSTAFPSMGVAIF
jgi:hypothetical protein